LEEKSREIIKHITGIKEVFTMRQFNKISTNEEGTRLEIFCYKFKPGELKKLTKSLEKKNFKLTFVDIDSIKGELVLAQYSDIIKVKNQFKKEGFSWSTK